MFFFELWFYSLCLFVAGMLYGRCTPNINRQTIATFREGIKWGVRLFARTVENKEVVGQELHPLERIMSEIDDGHWDDVLKNLNK